MEVNNKKTKKLLLITQLKDEADIALLKHVDTIEKELEQSVTDSTARLEKQIEDKISEVKNSFPTFDEVIDAIIIPEPIKGETGEKGEKGDSYRLTNEDRTEIAKAITVPIVEKETIIEKTEIFRELPIVTENVVEKALYEEPDQIVAKINSAKDLIAGSRIKGFSELEKMCKASMFNPTMGPSFSDLSKINARIDALGTGSSSLAVGTTAISGGTTNRLLFDNAGVLAEIAFSTTPTASTISEWDANINLSATNFINGWRTQAASAGSLTLVVTDKRQQYFTGTTVNQTVKLPTTGVVAGMSWEIVNKVTTTGIVTIQSSGANAIGTIAGGFKAILTALVATPTTAANWSIEYVPLNPVYSTKASSITAAQLSTSLGGSNTTGSGSFVLASAPVLTNPSFLGTVAMNDLEVQGVLFQAQGVNATAASTTILAGGNYFNIVGTPGTAIDFFQLAGVQPGTRITLYFQDTFVINNSPAFITLPLWQGTAVNITTQAYDVACFVLDVNFGWLLEAYYPYSGRPLMASDEPSGVVAGTYGDVNDIPVITVGANGIVTSVTLVKPVVLLPTGFKVANYTLNAGEFVPFIPSAAGGTGGNLVATLPTGAAPGTTCGVIIRGITTNGYTLTVQTAGGETINGTSLSSLVLTQLGQSIILTADGLGVWYQTGFNPSNYGSPSTVAYNDLLAQTATVSSIVSITPVGSAAAHTYEIGAYATITAISAGTLTITVTYTDESGTSRTDTFFSQGLTTAALSATGVTSFSPITIRARDNSAITLVATFAGVSITYDVGGYIKQIY